MKTMRTKAFSIIILAILISSCEKSEEPGPKPEIDFHELGYENSKTATIGDELHMDVEIVAENKIDRIEIEIHPEGEHQKSMTILLSGTEEWEFDSIYTKFAGLRNTEFHEHVEIPENAEPGQYHFHFAVTDQEGYQTVYEDELEFLSPGGSK